MIKLVPTIYQKDIYSIDYKKLYTQGKRVLLFDLDNTMVSYYEPSSSKKLIDLIKKLKKIGFTIHLFSNSIRGRKVKRIANELDIKYNLLSLKPLKYSYKKLMKKYNYKQEELVMIGDQFFTDILGGNRMNITTILVKPTSEKENILTKVMRTLENILKNKLKKEGIFEENKYYD